MTTKRPLCLFPMFSRVIVVIMCSVSLFGPISGFVEAVRKRDFLVATIAVGFIVFCVALIVLAVRFRRPSQEEFEAGIAAPLALPDRDPIDLSEPNWLVSRFLIQKLLPGQLEFGTVAIDIDANRICFQNCFSPKTKRFLKSVAAYNEVDLSEVLHVEVFRNVESPGRSMQIFTDNGWAFVPDHATNYESLLELLTRISKHTDELDFMRKPSMEKLLYGIAYICTVSAIIWILFQLV
jgi:hypothetical protein